MKLTSICLLARLTIGAADAAERTYDDYYGNYGVSDTHVIAASTASSWTTARRLP